MNINTLRELCNLHGGSGDEKLIHDYIYEHIKDKADEIIVDNLGNMIVTKKGGNHGIKTDKKIAITAHMDEVSFIVTYIRDDGTIAFDCVGGVNADTVLGRRISVNGHAGVIGGKAIHNMSADEKKAAPKFEDFSADIGCLSKEETDKFVSPGDRIYFEPNLTTFGDGKILSKAIDDRFGCAVLMSLLERNLPCDITLCFLTQEEVGCRGAKAADIDANFAIVVETTTAADYDGVSGDKRCCLVGGGAVVSFMDKGTVYDKELFEMSKSVAEKNNIKWQTKTLIAGGNDASAVNIKQGGIRTMAISIPCRYLHTANSVAAVSDMEAVELLVEKMIFAITEH